MTTTKARRPAKPAPARDALPRRLRLVVWLAVLGVLGVVVGAMLITSRPESSAAARTAPDFTLTDTSGNSVRLSDLRGQDVLLYFSEGAGCQICLVQMAEIERSAAWADSGLTVLPIVMNSREQIRNDMALNGVQTAFLLDDGTVAKAYGTLGKGMHAGLPGHSFVLVDSDGVQRWYREYPSMWASPDELLAEVRKRLATP